MKCCVCGKPAVALCDYRGSYAYHKGYYDPHDKFRKVHLAYETASLCTCDRPMCAEHANNYGELDYCDEHNNEVSLAITQKADMAFEKMLAGADKQVR